MKPKSPLHPKKTSKTKVPAHPRVEHDAAVWIQHHDLMNKSSRQLAYERELDSGTISLGGSLKKMLGYTPAELGQGLKQWRELIHPRDRKRALHLQNLARKNKSSFEAVYRIRRKDGLYIQVLDVGFLMPDTAGKVYRMVGTMKDITEHEHIRSALLESEERYRILFERVPVGLYRITPSGQILDFNLTGAKMLGYKNVETVTGQNVLAFLANPGDWKQFKKLVSQEGVCELENRMQKRDGKIIWVKALGMAIRNKNGKVIYYEGSLEDITERKNTEATLRTSEERLRSIVENSPAGIFTVDHKHKITFVNSEMSRLLKTPMEKVVGRDFQIFLDPSSRTLVMDYYLRRQRGEKVPSRYEFEIIRRDGEKRRMEISSTTITDPSGKVQTIGQFLDVTERKRAEEDLRQQLVFDELLTSVSTGFASCLGSEIDDQLQISLSKIGTFFGAESAIIVRARRDAGTWSMPYRWEKAGRRKTAEFHQDIPTGIFPWSSRMLTKGKAIKFNTLDELSPAAKAEHSWYRRAGVKSVMEVPFHGQGGLIDGCLGLLSFSHRMRWSPDDVRRLGIVSEVIANIFDRKRAEDESRRRTEELVALNKISSAMRTAQNRSDIIGIILQQLSEMLSAEGAAFVAVDLSTQTMTIERGYGEWDHWRGMRSRSVEGISGEVTSSDQPYRNNHAQDDPRARDPGQFGNLTCVTCVPLIANDQTIGALWIGRKIPITDDDMRLVTAIGHMAANAIHRQTLNEDIRVQLQTLQQTQKRLLQSEKLAAIGQLVSGVAHELNNPLTSVVLYAQLMQQEKMNEAARSNLSKVITEALRAGKIVRSLLDFTRQRPIHREITQINDVLLLSAELLAYELNSHHINLEIDLGQDLPMTMADPHRLQQVFVNLIQNAWQAMSATYGEGHLRIRTETVPTYFADISPCESKVIRISFEDDGPGIPDEIRDRIFDPFFTTKPEGRGTGLGLSICLGIIADHGGHIWAESSAGQGAKFFIELPVTPLEESQAARPASAKTPAPPVKDSRILVIDDEPNIQNVLAQSLRRRGYTVDIACNGADGLVHLSKASYNIILCDIRMPGLDGLEFYRQVQAKDKKIAQKIIFITGDTADESTRKFIEENLVKCLRKPFELADLLQVVQLTEES